MILVLLDRKFIKIMVLYNKKIFIILLMYDRKFIMILVLYFKSGYGVWGNNVEGGCIGNM